MLLATLASVFCVLSLSRPVAALRTPEQERNAGRNMSLGIAVFPGFEPLDVFGPLEMFYSLSRTYGMSLSIIAHSAGPVSAGTSAGVLQPSVLATHSFADAPRLDVLLVPGGRGTRRNDSGVEDFVRQRFARLDYLLSVCTGAVSLAKAGVLGGRRATTNKAAWAWATSHGDNVTWVPAARWVEDGKVWTSSGVSAGMDMTFAFLSRVYGEGDAGVTAMMADIEYAPHTNRDWDPFAVIHKVPGADPEADVTDCVRPVGY